jgi:hypothetical protein
MLQAPDPTKEADLVAVIVEREKMFLIGQLIELSAHDLHEIYSYHIRITERTLEEFVNFLKTRGIVS